jgi:NAD(P)-dependent dehydrogenase (short-subunit alcohol dehydrogenase family)
MATHEKVAFMTGTHRGLGLATARGRGKLGVTVRLGARDRATGAQAAAEFRRDGVAQVEPLALEVLKREDHRRVAALLEQRCGRRDSLVKNAGLEREGAVCGAPDGGNDTSTVSEAALRATFETNVFAVMALTQTLWPLLRCAPAGRIVTLSSLLGSLTLHADPTSPIDTTTACAFDASQTARNAFTGHLAAELQETPIKVNAAPPGWVQSALGGASTPLDVREGGPTSVQVARLPTEGPTGGSCHGGEPWPWECMR